MKTFEKTFLAATILFGLGFALNGCVGYVEPGPGYYDGRGYYGRDRWYHDGPWMDGPRGYIGIQINPIIPIRPPRPFRR